MENNIDFGAEAVKVAELVKPPLEGKELAMFIAGFTECGKKLQAEIDRKDRAASRRDMEWKLALESRIEAGKLQEQKIQQLQAELERYRMLYKQSDVKNSQLSIELKELKEEVRIFTERENNMT